MAKLSTPEPELNEVTLKNAGIAGSFLAVLDLNDTMVFPFLADFFAKRDLTVRAVGACFGALSIGMLLCALAMPKLMPRLGGPARTLTAGVVLFTGVRFVTASLPLVGTGEQLLIVASAVYFLTGCIYAFAEVGALTWVLYTASPGQKVPAMAALTSARTLGAMLGTPVGGVLFDLIGWELTNFVGGLLLVAPLIVFGKDVVQPIKSMTQEVGTRVAGLEPSTFELRLTG